LAIALRREFLSEAVQAFLGFDVIQKYEAIVAS
jgi:hypothetical protein